MVGWDRPLDTFFAMGIDPPSGPDGEEHLAFWIGISLRDIPTIAALRDRLAALGITLPDEIADQLEQDRRAEGNGWAGRPAALLFGSLMGGNA